MTGRCEDHRKALLDVNVEYYHAISWYRMALYSSWIGFAIVILLAVLGSR